jgi:hypothetical protein
LTQVPADLRHALDWRRLEQPAARPIHLHSSVVRRGDLRIIRPLEVNSSEPRLVLVLSVDRDREFADVLLVHTATELACEVDGIIHPFTSFASYDVVVQTDLRGVVWTWQLGRTVGNLDADVLQELGRATSGGTEMVRARSGESKIHVGPQLAGPNDPRWSFKEAEGASFRQITADCTEALLDKGSVWMVESGVLRPDLLDSANDKFALITELMHWTRTRSLAISMTDSKRLLELDVLQPEAWNDLRDLGVDIGTAYLELIKSAVTTTASEEATMLRLVTATHLEPGVSVSELDAIHYLGQKAAAVS